MKRVFRKFATVLNQPKIIDTPWKQYITDTTHENDLEGALVVVRKDGTTTGGTLEAVVTQAHGDLLTFGTSAAPKNSAYPTRSETAARRDPFGHSADGRPCTVQEHPGHGVRACGPSEDIDWRGEEDSIMYLPDQSTADVPAHNIPNTMVPIRYTLRPIQEIIDNQWEATPRGPFGGDCSGMDSYSFNRCQVDGANPPWKWGNEWAFDPAGYFAARFAPSGPVSRTYIGAKAFDGSL